MARARMRGFLSPQSYAISGKLTCIMKDTDLEKIGDDEVYLIRF
jgi:hypothetical protein